MQTRFLLAIPMALVWMMLTARISPASFGVGYVLGFSILTLLHSQGISLQIQFSFAQIIALVVYTVLLFRDIFLSSVDVARRLLSPEMPIKAGIIAVPTHDTLDVISALSAHGITITPGQLVVDIDSNHTMYVHCLDVEQSLGTAEADQLKRLKFLQTIWGREKAKTHE